MALHNFTNTGDGLESSERAGAGNQRNVLWHDQYRPQTQSMKFSSAGVFKTLHTLSATDGTSGGQPQSRQRRETFYGGMNMGGTNGYGTLFKMTASGTFTVLQQFFNGSDGTIAAPGMVQAASGGGCTERRNKEAPAMRGVVFTRRLRPGCLRCCIASTEPRTANSLGR